MHVPTHALIGWAVAHLAPGLDRRSRAVVFFASVIPDLDGLTILGGAACFETWHRILCHNVLFSLVCTALGAALVPRGAPAMRRAATAAIVWLNFHLHLLCDYLGSAGPDGSAWGIPYLQPFSDWRLDNPHQWQLNDRRNVIVTLVFLGVAVEIARRFGRSPLEPFSLRADAAVVQVIHARFGDRTGRAPATHPGPPGAAAGG